MSTQDLQSESPVPAADAAAALYEEVGQTFPGASPGSAPTNRNRSIPGPKRRGVRGWLEPKS